MLRGFTVSALVHASVLVMTMISWPQAGSECDEAIEKLRRENPGIRAIEIVVALPQCASVADLLKVDGVNQALAERIHAFFHPQTRR